MSTSLASRKLVIAFDCDDVLVSTSLRLLEVYNQQYGTCVEPKYLYDKHGSWGVPDDEAVRRVIELHRQKVVIDVAPSAETVKAITELRSAGHTLCVVTGRHEFQSEDTIRQLSAYFPGVFSTVVHTGYFGESPRSKADVCLSLGVDIFVDDHIKHCNDVARAGIRSILYGDYPWNIERITLDAAVECCSTMERVCREVDRVAGCKL